MKPETFGVIVATILCGALVWWLQGLSKEWDDWRFIALCLSGCVALLAIGWIVDRQRRAGSE
jgi:hypothetical protein